MSISSSSSSFSALRLLCHSGKVYLHKFNVGMVTQVRLLHLVVRVFFFFYDLVGVCIICESFCAFYVFTDNFQNFIFIQIFFGVFLSFYI